MKFKLPAIVVAIMVALALTACGKKDNEKGSKDKSSEDSKKGKGKDVKKTDPTQPGSGTKGPGSWKRITKNDLFKTARAGTIMDGKFYHVVLDGTMYVTDLSTGKMKTLSRKPDFGGVRWLQHHGGSLYSLEKDGSIYKISPTDASRKQVGERGTYKKTRAAALADGIFYTVEKDGTLYKTNLTTMKWKSVGKAEFRNTRFMMAGGGKVWTVEKDGSAFNVNPKTGKWWNLGPNYWWKKTVAATVLNGKPYRIAANGVLFMIDDKAKGKATPLGKPDFKHVRWMGADKDALVTLEKDGSLYRVQVK